MPDFLLEIGTEEIPARMMDSASWIWESVLSNCWFANRYLIEQKMSTVARKPQGCASRSV